MVEVDLAVVGGGITGLAAAWEGVKQGAEVVVLEAAERPGGKVLTSPLGGDPVDEAADAFLARVPDALDLCDELGLRSELISPTAGSAFVWSEGALRRLPSEQLLGVPTDLDALAAGGILSAAGLERARADLTLPGDRPPGDEALGALIRRRLGDEVLDRLVGPLVGGIYAGDCDGLSLQVAAPAVATARDRDGEPSLVRAAAAARAANLAAARAAGDRPVFLAPRGGMGTLVTALAERLGDRVRTSSPVASVTAEGHRWRLEPAGALADAVVLATPAFGTAPLVAPHAPVAAEMLAGVDYASVTLVGLVVPRDRVEHGMDGSGYLVPASSGLLLTACSWVSSKWCQRARPGEVVLRASAGRAGDERAGRLDDEALVAALIDDLGTTMGLRGAPEEARVSRWPRSFPQPRPGHLDRVAAAEADLAARAPRLAVTGAWARGVGIPACIRGGREAARTVLGHAGR